LTIVDRRDCLVTVSSADDHIRSNMGVPADMKLRTNALQQAAVAAGARPCNGLGLVGHGYEAMGMTDGAGAAWSSNAKRFATCTTIKRPARHLGSPTT
jgi:hypothetical protein